MKFRVEYLGEDRLFDDIKEAVTFVEEHSKNECQLEIKPIEGESYTEEEMSIMYFGMGRVISF